MLVSGRVHPGRLTWNLQITHLERNIIFQTSMIMVHVNLPGCMCLFLFGAQICKKKSHCLKEMETTALLSASTTMETPCKVSWGSGDVVDVGGFLKWWYPPKHPKMVHF